SMEFFMENDKGKQSPEIEVEGVARFSFPEGHELAGQPIPWILKPITTKQMEDIQKRNTVITRNKGITNSITDQRRATREMILETIVFPDFKDPKWLESTKFVDPVDLLMDVLSLPGDFTRITSEVMDINGLGDNKDDLIKEAKN
ncbi:phage tail assembly chaperone, partial [Enterococcus faecium]|uniref:phage tail assembly chaperone n=1 Tax=Enterococcus faecium TaxID=1352 RepID=UPI002073FA4F